MFGRRRRQGALLPQPYKRATAAPDGRWVQDSLQRQMFHDAFERDETQIADCDARVRVPSHDGTSLPARLVATDRALHARVTLGAGVHRTMRLHYDQVKYVEVVRPDETDVEVVYFNPDRAIDERWHLRLDGSHARSGFGATLVQLVSQRATARAAAAELVEAEAGRRAAEKSWTVATRPDASRVEVA